MIQGAFILAKAKGGPAVAVDCLDHLGCYLKLLFNPNRKQKGEASWQHQPRKIFVNLPVKDLDKSMTFFKALGFTFNAQFTDETAACMVISDDIYAMLLTHKKFKEFTPKAIADTARLRKCSPAFRRRARTR